MKARTVIVSGVCILFAAMGFSVRFCSKEERGSDGSLDRAPNALGADASLEVSRPSQRASKEANLPDWTLTAEEQRQLDATEAVFHGKVIDQFGSPVSGAEVVYQANYDVWTGSLRRNVINTADDGTFFIREKDAPTLKINASASGYYSTSASGGLFGFASVPASMPEFVRQRLNGPTITSRTEPVVLKLRKMGATEPLVHRIKTMKLAGEQLFSIGTGPSHTIQVKYWFDGTSKRLHGVTGAPVYDWGVEIGVAGGGVVRTGKADKNEPESFFAPVEGYRPSDRWEFTSAMADSAYRDEVGAHYFVKFSDGTYARITVDFRSNPKRPFGAVESWFNPSGSRATEYDPVVGIKAPAPK